ncbi:MAG TPA: two-component regulator propeller domain-containing protein [Verrucomicrobiae bacterium]
MKRRIHFFVIGLVAALVLGQRAAADSPFIVDSWNTADGLPQSSVIALTQTRDGYLWLGTLHGLVRFDGHSFTRFNVNNTPGLPGNGVIFLFEDSRTNLWIGTDNGGLCAMQNGVIKKIETGGTAGKITSAFEDKAGTVWFSNPDGMVLRWQHGKLESRTANITDQFSLELFYRSAHLLVLGKNDVTWQLQGGRVLKFRGGRLEKDFGASPWTCSLVLQSFKTSSGYVGAVTIDANVTAACEDRDGNLVVGTHGAGVYWFNAAGGCSHILTDKRLSHGVVLSLGFDNDGNLWAGTDGDGIERIKKNLFETPPEFSGGVAKSAAEDAQGGIWATFNSRGLTYRLTNSVQNFGIGTYSNAWSVLVDARQQVWAGTRGEGLFRFRFNRFQPEAAANQIGKHIFALFQGRDGKLWVGGQNGLGCFDGQRWKFFSTGEGLPPNAVRAIADDAGGNLWIGTDGGGLFLLRDGKISSANAPANDISCLLADVDGALWTGTFEHGLARFQNGRWTTYSARDGLPDDIGYLVEDDLKNLWLGSYEGLQRVSFTNDADGTAKILGCRTFGKSDGLPVQECSAGAQPAAIRARDGRLWLPTIAGLISVQPGDLKLNTNPPVVIIESVWVDDVQQNTNLLSAVGNGPVILTPKNEQLKIRFTGLNFSAPDRVRFKYLLEGHDKKWTPLGGLREVLIRAADLPPGTFTFRVTACNEDGFWNETGATLTVTVEPPFWRKPGFIVTAILVFIGTLAGIIYLISTAKLKRQLRHAQQKELIEKERARIARDLHDQLGANLTQVALLGEMAEADKDLPGEVGQHAQQICETARETTRSLDEIVWAVNPANDTLEGLVNYACKYAQDYFALAGVSYRAEMPPQLPSAPIPPEVRHNVFLAFKEAVNNVVKHAHASEARVKFQLGPERFILSITDNGIGLGDPSEKQLRNGLKNMRKRLADVRGEFEISPGANGGTVVKLTVPVIMQT